MRKFLSTGFLIFIFCGFARAALTVQSVSPGRDSIGAALNSDITAEFSENISLGHMSDSDKSTFNNIFEVFRITDNNGIDLLVPARAAGEGAVSGKTLTFNPYTDFTPGYKYEVVLSTNIKDTLGNPLDEEDSWYFTAIYDASEKNTFTGSDGKTKAVLQAGTLPADGYVEININPLVSAALATSAELSAAHSAALTELDPYIYPINSTMKEFAVYSGSSTLLGDITLAGSARVYLPYPNSLDGRFVDGTNPPVPVDNLNLYYFNTALKKWIAVDNISIDKNSKMVSASVTKLSIFVLMGSMRPGLKDVFAYPTPFMPNSKPNHTSITFANLLPDSKIEIFTVTGVKVRELYSGSLGFDVSWDGRNYNGEKLSSGVYIYRASRGKDSKTGKLMIIR